LKSAGTIDESAFRADLAAISQNDYPPLQLVKLPFNWFAPQTAGIIQTVSAVGVRENITSFLFPNPVQNGSTIVIINGGTSMSGASIWTSTAGDVFTNAGIANIDNYQELEINVCMAAVGGARTFSALAYGGSYDVFRSGFFAFEIGGVVAVRAFAGSQANTATVAAHANDLVLFSAMLGYNSLNPTAGVYGGVYLGASLGVVDTNNNFAVTLPNVSGLYVSTTKPTAAGNVTDGPTGTSGYTPVCALLALQMSTGGGATINQAPVTSIPLNGPMNLLALVSEALDEQGIYQKTSLLGQQAAAGFVRLNGPGNVWIPISFVSPLTPGYVTTLNNYGLNPLAGTGFSEIEGPFHQLDWKPAAPQYYTGPTPPTTPAGFLLAFVGTSMGVGAAVGAGNSSTYAIPTAAGPVDRMKRAGLL
jgi:hypothetical protein